MNRSGRKTFLKSGEARSVEKCMDDLQCVCGVCYFMTNLQPPTAMLFELVTLFFLWGSKDCMIRPIFNVN